MADSGEKTPMYAEVLLPLKFKERITYSIPEEWAQRVVPGSLVKVTVVGRLYTAVVREVSPTPRYGVLKNIKPIQELTPFPPLTLENLTFMDRIASYYLCSQGEVFRAGAPSTVKALKRRPQKTASTSTAPAVNSLPLPRLNPDQALALEQIRQGHQAQKTVLLNGVTGSGKTEIYLHLAAETLEKGKNVLYLVPEIALSRQLEHRLEQVFGERLLVFHSKQTPARRRTIYEAVAQNEQPHVVLGLRSALFLPFKDLGLIIVDEEHDASYKQKEPAPRYNGRDAAIFLGQIQACPVLLGSATPSFESLYNVRAGRFEEVRLTRRHFEGSDCPIRVVDMRKERRKRAVKGAFSLTLIKAIRQRLERGEQCLIFRSRRAYATWMECPECGYVPKCPHCNVSLNFHKAQQYLSCHYCGYTSAVPGQCPECSQAQLEKLGSGTERLEEELHELFPDAQIARFDAETTQNRQEEEALLKRFENKEIDILVGTQMIAKGFDFPNLTLTAVIQAEALTTLFDFRADERAIQLLNQLRGRAGRRDLPGEMIIQTTQPEHSVFQWAGQPHNLHQEQDHLLAERQAFAFPPFSRMILLTLKHQDPLQLALLAEGLKHLLGTLPSLVFSGPAPPPIDRIQGEFLLQFHIRIPRNRFQEQIKKELWNLLLSHPQLPWTVDVDPY